jgi:hypothetical protein
MENAGQAGLFGVLVPRPPPRRRPLPLRLEGEEEAKRQPPSPFTLHCRPALPVGERLRRDELVVRKSPRLGLVPADMGFCTINERPNPLFLFLPEPAAPEEKAKKGGVGMTP